MTSAEWQDLVRLWMVAEAVEQDLWSLLSNATIIDADQGMLDAQMKMELLTAEEGGLRLKRMLESNPGLRDHFEVSQLLERLLVSIGPSAPNAQVAIDNAYYGDD